MGSSDATQTELPNTYESDPSRDKAELFRGEFDINYYTDFDSPDISVNDLANNLQLLPVTGFLCQPVNGEEHCVETNLNDVPQPTYTLGECKNVVSSVRYVLGHNGTEGFSSVRANVHLINVSNSMTRLTQSFSARYIWASTKDTVVFERSGRPGYLTGKPIILGKLMDNTTEEGKCGNHLYHIYQ